MNSLKYGLIQKSELRYLLQLLEKETENPHGKYFGEEALSKSEKMEEFIEMCFEPNTKANQKLKEALKKLMEEANE